MVTHMSLRGKETSSHFFASTVGHVVAFQSWGLVAFKVVLKEQLTWPFFYCLARESPFLLAPYL